MDELKMICDGQKLIEKLEKVERVDEIKDELIKEISDFQQMYTEYLKESLRPEKFLLETILNSSLSVCLKELKKSLVRGKI